MANPEKAIVGIKTDINKANVLFLSAIALDIFKSQKEPTMIPSIVKHNKLYNKILIFFILTHLFSLYFIKNWFSINKKAIKN